MAEETEQKLINPFEIFSERTRENVVGLSYVGHLERSVTFCGHTFVLKTLRPSEKAAVATAIQPWRETLAESIAWANGHVGLALVSVDGDDSFCPPAGPDIAAHARARLNYVTNPETGWYQPTLDFLFNFYLSVEQEVLNAVQEFQDLADGSQQVSQPSADSLIALGTSTDETPSDIPPSDSSS
jgi:hypothetical protein